ncbi:MAG: hypothetical protein H0W77_12875 [Acidobacteria bacterium]|nr:hypothetical protein [Acidobacteriota bacterium]
MKEKTKAGAFGLLIIFLSLTACRSSAHSENSLKGGNPQPTTKIETQDNASTTPIAAVSPTPTKSENPFTILPAELATKGKLTSDNVKSCQSASEITFKQGVKVRTYRVDFASSEKSVIIEDYAANREIVNVKGEQANPSIDENLVNEYILSAKAGQAMTLQVSPPQRKEIKNEARIDVGGLYLEITTLDDCKNVEKLPLA